MTHRVRVSDAVLLFTGFHCSVFVFPIVCVVSVEVDVRALCLRFVSFSARALRIRFYVTQV